MAFLSFLVTLSCLFGDNYNEPKFEAQVIDNNVQLGYGLAIGDVNGDGRPDILMADKKQFVWYRNGDWKRFVMVENLTEYDNVCIAARDINGDGKVEVAVGAQWNPSETSDSLKSGSVHYLIRPSDPTRLWTPVELHHEVTVHRMKWVKNARKSWQLIVVPLHGKNNKNGEGTGVKVLAYDVPKNPKKKWKYSIVDQSMHLTHNVEVLEGGPDYEFVLIAGKEGVKAFRFYESNWKAAGQDNFWITDQSFGEIRTVYSPKGALFAGISPMHGNELAVYYQHTTDRTLLTDDLGQGHALAAADLLRGGADEIVVGWRTANKENKVGIKMFVADPAKTGQWNTYWIDEDGMACEDLQVADLDGDGRKDIIASGRASHNLKIYWNRTER